MNSRKYSVSKQSGGKARRVKKRGLASRQRGVRIVDRPKTPTVLGRHLESQPLRGRAKILLATCNSKEQDYIGGLLSHQYELTCFTKARSALIELKKQSPDLVIADVTVLQVHRSRFIKTIRARAETNAIPVVALCASPDEAAKGLRHGANDYVLKPLNEQELTARVAAQIALARARRGKAARLALERRARVLAEANAALSVEPVERKQMELILRSREHLIQAIFDNCTNAIVLKDSQGRYLLVNKQFEKELGLSQEQIKGKRDDEVFPVQQAASFHANDAKVLQAGLPMEFEEVAQQSDGPHTSIVQKFPMFDADGKIYALGGIVTDITIRKRIEEELKLQIEVLQSIPTVAWTVRPDGRCVRAWEPHEIISQHARVRTATRTSLVEAIE